MKQKKISFFIRLKNAITNFDEYKVFAEEKTRVAIKYILKLMLIFSIIVSLSLSYKLTKQTNSFVQSFKEECPDFKIENNILTIEGENKQFFKYTENQYFSFLINSEKEDLKDVEEINDYQIIIAALKDKIIIKNYSDIESSITYEELFNRYNIDTLNKESIFNLVTENNMIKLFAIFTIISIIYLYIAYTVQALLDILLLTVVGFILSKIIGVKFKYKSIFNMSVYSITLSIILYMIYICANLFTGFTIKYFEIAYNAIAYIYIITAMLMIKSDLIKQQIEVGKIIEEQKKVREERQKEKEEKQEKQEKDKQEEQKENKNKKKKDEKGEEGTPEGSKA